MINQHSSRVKHTEKEIAWKYINQSLCITFLSQQPDAGPIQVRNDAYKQPEPPVVLHQVVSQPVYQQSYYTEPEPSVPVVSTPTPPVRSPLERATRLSHTASTLSMIQSRLGEDPNVSLF